MMIGYVLYAKRLYTNYKANQKNQLSYVISHAPTQQFCNGDKMDSAGYSKTINVVKIAPSLDGLLPKEQQANAILFAASGNHNRITRYFQRKGKALVRIQGSTATIAPIDGWPGISIFMCAWKPLVEKNLLRLPFIKRVVWS